MYMATSALRSSSSALGRERVRPDEADADAGAREDLLAVDLDGQLDRSQEADRCVGGVRGVLHPVEQHGELVAAEPRHRVRRTDGGRQPLRHLPQHAIAGRVAQAVVDRLEVVQVDEHHRHRRCRSLRADERVLDAVREERAVGEVRDRIVERLVGELILERLPLAHVAAVEHDAPDVLVLEQVGALHLELQPRFRRDDASVHSIARASGLSSAMPTTTSASRGLSVGLSSRSKRVPSISSTR